jgi:YhcG PDDEXK nuclease domain
MCYELRAEIDEARCLLRFPLLSLPMSEARGFSENFGEFEPAHKGQVELYLKWLSKYEKEPGEEEPIALILCAGKDAELVELLDLERDNIHVAEYWLQLPSKDVLQAKLRLAIAQAQARIEAQEGEMP